MYIPASFEVDSIDDMHAMMRAHPLATLVTHGNDGLQASPIPFLTYADGSGAGTLRAHVARANPHWMRLGDTVECLVIFNGPDAYVSPSWYATKVTTHKVVPTWNYAAVHAWGIPSLKEDPAWLRRQLEDLTELYEGRRSKPWAVADAPDDFIAAQMKAIIGIEIRITRIEGKLKASQNRVPSDRHGVVEGMMSGDDPHRNPAMAELVSRGRLR